MGPGIRSNVKSRFFVQLVAIICILFVRDLVIYAYLNIDEHTH